MLLPVLFLVAWSAVFIGVYQGVRALTAARDDPGIVYSDTLIRGEARIETCTRGTDFPYRCAASIAFEGQTVDGRSYRWCTARTVISMTPLSGTVPVLGHYRTAGRSGDCSVVTTVGYPHASAATESHERIVTWVWRGLLVAWMAAGIAVLTLLHRWRRRSS